MFQTEWPVLLVDDDPDVLAVSKLAMKSFEIDGVPIKLFTATSKDEAVKLLSGPLGSTALPYVSVAFIDVVMETDHAGLDKPRGMGRAHGSNGRCACRGATGCR